VANVTLEFDVDESDIRWQDVPKNLHDVAHNRISRNSLDHRYRLVGLKSNDLLLHCANHMQVAVLGLHVDIATL
jgi:hypothetical protein